MKHFQRFRGGCRAIVICCVSVIFSRPKLPNVLLNELVCISVWRRFCFFLVLRPDKRSTIVVMFPRLFVVVARACPLRFSGWHVWA